jgi:hypothetical protein
MPHGYAVEAEENVVEALREIVAYRMRDLGLKPGEARALGDKRYIGGVGGGESGRYWLAAKEAAGTTELLVYDTQRKLCTDRC